jgi:hypothetical protein
MGISNYQKNNAIKAYTKQGRWKFRLDANSAPSLGQHTDEMTLSTKEDAVISSSSNSTSDICNEK